jgi:hypothetical protein
MLFLESGVKVTVALGGTFIPNRASVLTLGRAPDH